MTTIYNVTLVHKNAPITLLVSVEVNDKSYDNDNFDEEDIASDLALEIIQETYNLSDNELKSYRVEEVEEQFGF